MIGTTVSHYEILDKIGEGGMGVVYLARDTRLNRLVALKFLPPDPGYPTTARARFVTEARAASALNHPNVAVVYDVGETETSSFIAMEFVDGESLRARLERERLAVADVIALGSQVADGLHAAHTKGIVHRDVKPDNLLLTREGGIKIMDFGIAKLDGDQSKLTHTGTTLGTFAYMSPEQVLADNVDHRSDLWSLGVVLYEMLAGQTPFNRDREAAILYEIISEDAPPLEKHRQDVPPRLRDLVMRLLQKEPGRRPASAQEVAEQLRGTASASSTAPAPPPAKSIAVLYFENMSSDREGDYVCAGITEDIITDLSKVRELRVVSRTDMLPFRNKEINIRQVADALRVNYVLEGSVRKSGNRIRITAQLISAQDGFHLWADRFDGLLDDIFDLQNEVARRIAEALKVSLTQTEQESLAKKPTDDLRAYDLYLRGREFLLRRGKRNTETAVRMFEAALDMDRDFARAYAALAEACTYMYEWYDGDPAWLARAIEMNQQALERDAASLDAQFGIAMVYYHQGRLPEAARALQRLLEADPQHLPSRIRLGMIVEREAGADLRDAVRRYREAAELRPHDDEPWRRLAAVHKRLGDAESARDAAIKVIEITSLRLEASVDDVVLLARLAEAYAQFGGREETHAVIRRVMELDPTDGLVLYYLASAQAMLGEVGPAIVMLRRAFECGFRGVVQAARMDGTFEPISGHPEFSRLVAELESGR